MANKKAKLDSLTSALLGSSDSRAGTDENSTGASLGLGLAETSSSGLVETSDSSTSHLAGSREVKTASSPSSPTGEGAKKATFVLSVDTLDKLNYISLMTGVTLKAIVQTTLDDMVDSYEKRYGEIHIEKRRLSHGKL